MGVPRRRVASQGMSIVRVSEPVVEVDVEAVAPVMEQSTGKVFNFDSAECVETAERIVFKRAVIGVYSDICHGSFPNLIVDYSRFAGIELVGIGSPNLSGAIGSDDIAPVVPWISLAVHLHIGITLAGRWSKNMSSIPASPLTGAAHRSSHIFASRFFCPVRHVITRFPPRLTYFLHLSTRALSSSSNAGAMTKG